MISLFLAVFSAKLAASFSCYGTSETKWSTDTTPVCTLTCTADSGAVTTYDLSTDDTNFAIIKDYWSDIRYVGCAWSDLTFGTPVAGQYCHPRCTCATADTVTWRTSTWYDSTVCAKCTCQTDGTTLGENCNSITWTDRYESATTSCPPPSCTIGSRTFYVGQSWQWISDSTGACKWCECTAQDTYNCYGSSDWATAKTNENFKDDCYYYLKGCWDDTSKWESASYCSCPRCGCDPSTYTASYTKSNSGYIGNNYDCNYCTCTADSSFSSGGYERCEQIANSWTDFDCNANLPTCKSGSEGSLSQGNTDHCVPGLEDYCGVSQWFYPHYDRDTGYSSDSTESAYFNCQMNFVCQGFDAIDTCAKGVYDLTLYTYDCEAGTSSSQQVTGTSYFQCCKNTAADGSCISDTFTLDKDNCVYSETLTNFYKEFFECQYGDPTLFDTAFGRSIFCNEDTDTSLSTMTQTEKCDKINELLNSQYKCYCNAIGTMFNNLDTTNQNVLSEWWTNFVTSVADHYNTQFGACDIDFACDLTTGTTVVTATVTTISFTMTFPVTITAAEIKSIVAATLGIDESYITVTLSSRRRLQTTQTATIKVEYTGSDSTKSANIKATIESSNTVWVDSNGDTVSGITTSTATVTNNRGAGSMPKVSMVVLLFAAFIAAFVY